MSWKGLIRIALAGLALGLCATVALAEDEAPRGHDVLLVSSETPHHIAERGDTLWDLSHRYFGDRFQWPRLWAFNTHITNPHWIYPGDVVFLDTPQRMSIDEMEQATLQRAGGSRLDLGEDAGRYFLLSGFYTEDEIPPLGQLKYALTERRFLSPTDQVYLEFEDPDAVQIGDELVLNRIEGRVYEGRRNLVGVKYRATGRARVTSFHDDSDLVSAEITHLWDTIERNDLLFAAQPQLILVEPRVNTVDLEAQIVDRLDPIRILGPYMTLFINVGHQDGVEVGNRVFLWERRDGAESIRTARRAREYDRIEEELPWEVMGDAIVIHSGSTHSTVLVTSSRREVEVGQRVTLQSGF